MVKNMGLHKTVQETKNTLQSAITSPAKYEDRMYTIQQNPVLHDDKTRNVSMI